MVLQLWESRSSPTLIEGRSVFTGRPFYYIAAIILEDCFATLAMTRPFTGILYVTKTNLYRTCGHCEERSDEAIPRFIHTI